jgi:ATP-binding cassette subfamily B protein
MRHHRGRIVAAVVLSVLVQLCIGSLPLLQKVVIDEAITSHELPLAPLLVLMVAIGAVAFVLNIARRTCVSKVCTDVQHRLRLAIHRHLHHLDQERHDQLSTGDVMSRATTDLTLIDLYLNQLSLVVNNLTLLIVALVVMAWLSPVLSLVVAGFVPLFLFLAARYRHEVFPSSWNDSVLAAQVAGVVDEAVSGVRVVKAFAQEDRELGLLADRSRDLFRSRLRTARITAWYTAALQTLPGLAQFGVLALGGVLALHGHLTLGVFVAFSSYLVQLVSPIRMLAALMTTSQQARASAERVLDLLAVEPGITDAPGAVDLVAPVGTIELDRVTFAYGSDAPVLRDVSLRIAAGERVALVGGSGSGKSSLAALITRSYEAQQGTVRVDGRDVRSWTRASLGRHTGVVFEDAFLFSTSVAENLAFGAPDSSAADIEAAARAAQAHGFI